MGVSHVAAGHFLSWATSFRASSLLLFSLAVQVGGLSFQYVLEYAVCVAVFSPRDCTVYCCVPRAPHTLAPCKKGPPSFSTSLFLRSSCVIVILYSTGDLTFFQALSAVTTSRPLYKEARVNPALAVIAGCGLLVITISCASHCLAVRGHRGRVV